MDNPTKFLNVPPNQRAFQSVLQAMAFVTCEFSDDLGSQLSFERLMKSGLVLRCLSAENIASVSPYLDENFLISVVHLALKTWIKAGPSEERLADPFKALESVLSPNSKSS